MSIENFNEHNRYSIVNTSKTEQKKLDGRWPGWSGGKWRNTERRTTRHQSQFRYNRKSVCITMSQVPITEHSDSEWLWVKPTGSVQASVEGRLPVLRHPDISENKTILSKLKMLEDEWTSSFFKSLWSLTISSSRKINFIESNKSPLTRLQRLETVCHPQSIRETLELICKTVERN